MKVTSFVVLIFFCFCFNSVFAQNGSISGTVVDEGNNEVLIGATISVQGTQKGTVTDIDGKFQVEDLSAGTYTLKVSYIGYESKEVTGVVVTPNEVTTLTITLGMAKANTLTEVVVTAEARQETVGSLLAMRKK